ncbi:dienelactone hydrolase family protein [Akkermansiaceae bacterium]|nr:dienelactone hydrolase family protein [Akkermansiaceae bacterium]
MIKYLFSTVSLVVGSAAILSFSSVLQAEQKSDQNEPAMVDLSMMSGPKVDAADFVQESVEYKDGDFVLEGVLVHQKDASDVKEKLPVILIVHQWMGITVYEKTRAMQLADMGYLVLCVDIYGKGQRPKDRGEAGKYAGKYKSDRGLFRSRLTAGLNKALEYPQADSSKVAAIGYCFGGTGVLELARTGADLDGVISFHGGIDSLKPEEGANIKSKVLVCHGAVDPHVKTEDITAFEKEMIDYDVDWQLISYGGAVHSFTQPMAGNDPSKGAAYDKEADYRSFGHMKQFLNELFE